MPNLRTETSIISSLSELKAIEKQRLADERASRERDRQVREDLAREVARRAHAEADAAREAALADAARRDAAIAAEVRERDTQIAIAAAAERVRAEAELDRARLEAEMALRHDKVARTRPVGLIAALAAAVLATGGLGIVIAQQAADSSARHEQIRALEDEQAQAKAREAAAAAKQRELEGAADAREDRDRGAPARGGREGEAARAGSRGATAGVAPRRHAAGPPADPAADPPRSQLRGDRARLHAVEVSGNTHGMTKWIALVTALALALPAAGCRRKTSEEQVDTSERPSHKHGSDTAGGGSGSALTAEAGSAEQGSAAPLKPGELPAECNDYSAAMQKLAACTSIPQTTRDALKQTYAEASKSWATMTPESKATIAKACKGGADGVQAAVAGCK